MAPFVIPLIFVMSCLPGWAAADTVLAATAIRAGSILTSVDLKMSDVQIAGALRDKEQAIGRQTNRNLFPGHAVFSKDLKKPSLIKRNQLVTLAFNQNGLSIVTEGRALEEGAVGDRIRVLNASSRSTVIGTVLADGSVTVSGVSQ